MAVSVANIDRFKLGNGYGVLADVTFDNAYPTGGEVVSLPLNAVKQVFFENVSGYMFEYVEADKKIKVYTPVGTATAHTHAVVLDTGASAAPSATGAVATTVPVSLAGIQGTLTAGKTYFVGPHDNAANETEDIFFVAPAAGKIKAAYATLETAPGGAGETAKKLTFKVRVNKVDSPITFEIAANAVAGSDANHEIAVTAGQKVSVSCVTAASTVAAGLALTLIYEITAGTAAVPTATHTHAAGNLADAASGTGGALSVAAASEVANLTDLHTLVVKIFALGY